MESPNLYAVIIAIGTAVITMIGNAIAVYFAYKANVRNVEAAAIPVAEKLAEVHVAVNGNLSLAQSKASKYAKLLREHGIEPDNFPDAPPAPPA